MKNPVAARKLDISGVVQGVGFRPFLFVLARQYDLKGEVSNTSEGVCAIVEGKDADIDAFVHDITAKPPLLACVTAVRQKTIEPRGFSCFQIVKSKAMSVRTTLISPDVSICRDCLKEMRDPSDRRYEYPFINCTNCGPRFTIIEDIPYDRPKTSMKNFKMCPLCQQEYDNPVDRRFHAQPNACPKCGPTVFLTDNTGRVIDSDSSRAIKLAADFLNQGKILAVKGLGGFHLACNAADSGAVEKLRHKKNRPHKPFALMAENISVLDEYVHVSQEEKQALESFHRPIVLLQKKHWPENADACVLAPGLAPANNCLGVMLPYTPLHYLLLEKGPEILVMTSGNRSGEPLSIDNDDALDAFSHIADFFLMHNRDIYFRADDSIVRFQAGRSRFIRRSRGYAPLPIVLNSQMPAVLACGGGLKSTICLTRNNQAFLSQHIGDLDNIKVFDFFSDTIDHLKNILDIRPQIIAFDLHPGYMSTKYAQDQKGIKKTGVQHHHAHAASCMAENGLDEPVIAMTLDGTGYGLDGNIWGGEIFCGTPSGFERKAHLSYIRMPGGDAAVKEPWRMGISVLYHAFGMGFRDIDIEFVQRLDKKAVSLICQMMDKGLNSPLTSSTGRLFDAVAALLCICHEISYESQAAMELESAAQEKSGTEPYDFELIAGASACLEINMLPCIRQIVEDLIHKTPVPLISSKFHSTIVAGFVQAAENVSIKTGIRKVVLSGGVFNNDRIIAGMTGCLEEKKFKVYTHSKVPAGDGGISLGQAVIAAAMEGN